MTLPRMINSLLDPCAYPGAPEGVELRQTHISYVLLTPRYAYKIKKPVDFGFLDFTTLDKRRFYCEEEVRLNRRLSKGIYLGVAPITEEGGRVAMEGRGVPIEWAVKMKRIPDACILEEAVKNEKADVGTIRRIARAIAAFHARAETGGRINAFGSIEAIRANTDENFAQTLSYTGKTVSKKQYEGLKEYTQRFLESNADLFNKRAEGGFIKDCHGDLHTEHVCLTNGIDIIDCIEFNERFRFSDTVSDMAFLSMDLDYHGRGDLSRTLEDEYFKAASDTEGARLLGFYKCYRACVRAKVAGFKSSEEDVPEEERRAAQIDAMLHFRLAALYAKGGFHPALVMVRGLSGTGKSRLAGALCNALGAAHLSSDAVRKGLAGVPPSEHRYEAYGQGIYSAEFTDRTYSELAMRAAGHLRSGRNVVVDATFSKAGHLKRMSATGEEAGASAFVIECTAKDETLRERLSRRAAEGPGSGAVSDADWEICMRQKTEFEDAGVRRLFIEAERPFGEKLLSAAGFVCGLEG